VYLESGLSPTRKGVLAPGSIGVYSGGSIYNPAQVVRDDTVKPTTAKIDRLVGGLRDRQHSEVPIGELQLLIELTMPDPRASERVWNPLAVSESLAQFGKLHGQTTGYLYVDRERDVKGPRGETQGILTGGEAPTVPNDKVALFLLRMKGDGRRQASWWPQIRFPDGRYAFAFAV